MTRKFNLLNLFSELYAIIFSSGLPCPEHDDVFENAVDYFYHYFEKRKLNLKQYTMDKEEYIEILNSNRNNLTNCYAILLAIDMFIDIKKIMGNYDNNSTANLGYDNNFQALNDNYLETGVYVSPRPNSLRNRFGDEHVGKRQKTALYWTDTLKDKLNNLVVYHASELNGITVNYSVYSLKKEFADEIKIGLTPVYNGKMEDLFDINYIEDGTFEISKYKNPNMLKNRFVNAIKFSNKNGISLLIGPEMLGTDELSYNHCDNTSSIINKCNLESPMLIVTPSKWENNENYVTLFDNKGAKLGKQNKINSFELSKDGTKYKEKLNQIGRNEVHIMIVPGIGRIGILICVDYLNDDLQRLMVKTLKVDLLICPSYSPKMAQFRNEKGSVTKFGTRMIYLNSCSAEPNTSCIGYYTWPELEENSKYRNEINLEKKCNKCENNCVFVLTIKKEVNRNDAVTCIHECFDLKK